MAILRELREYRNQFFKEVGKKRALRILLCSFFIAIVWCFADYISGSLEPKFRDDLICLGIGIISERLIPWGKSTSN